VAEVHTILANGGVARGRRFLSEAGCRRALEPQIEGYDLVLGRPMRFGLGFGLDVGLNPNTIWWGGHGGSMVIIDLDARTTFAYTMNRMSNGDLRALGLAFAMWDALGA
jgi:CubicO group peptidase (beta-lactamase class C family)